MVKEKEKEVDDLDWSSSVLLSSFLLLMGLMEEENNPSVVLVLDDCLATRSDVGNASVALINCNPIKNAMHDWCPKCTNK